MLNIKNVSKTLGDKKILDQCTLDVEEGSIVGLIGINGAGKSTLFRCIAGIYQADEGSITFNEQEIYNNEKIKKDILFLSDDPYYPAQATMQSVKQFYQVFYDNFNEEKYQEYITMLKLDEKAPLHNFSKGMKKQAFIILMLSLEPKLLIMDETFDGLDPMMRIMMKKVIASMVADTNAIVLISSHNLNDIESICDHYVILDDQHLQTSAIMDDNREKFHYYQLAFKETQAREAFEGLKIVDLTLRGKVTTLIVEGKQEDIEQRLKSMNPILLEKLAISLEEIFVAKVKGGDFYG